MFYYFCGHRGCGKTYLANQISKETQVNIVDTGPIIREVHKKYSQEGQSFKDWITENEKKHGDDFSNEVICRSVDVNKQKDYIIVGFRSMQGIKYFNKRFGINNFRIIFIDGEHDLFRNNYNKREKLNISKEEYQKIVESENITGLEEIKQFVKDNSQYGEYYYKIQNDNSIYESMMRKINEMER